MAEEHKIDKYNGASCSLVLHIDGNELVVPIDFGSMSDKQIRNLYPYLLDISNDIMDNPAIQYHELEQTGLLDKLSDADRDKYTNYIKKLSSYWYNKSSASLLDIALGIAVDIKFNNLAFGSILSDKKDVNIPNSIYEIYLNELNDNITADFITDEDLHAVENEYNLQPDSETNVTIEDEINPYKRANNDMSSGYSSMNMANIYGGKTGGRDDYISEDTNIAESNGDIPKNASYEDAMRQLKQNNENVNRDSILSRSSRYFTDHDEQDDDIVVDKNGIMVRESIVDYYKHDNLDSDNSSDDSDNNSDTNVVSFLDS